MPNLSVVIAYYKNTSFLKLVLKGLANQSEKSFEIIIAEDDNTLDINEVLSEIDFINNLNIQHVSQENIGFRKCRILNKAIKAANTHYIVFIDGDCIPHNHFVREYMNLRKYDCVFGRRVMLRSGFTKSLIKSHNKLSFFRVLFNSTCTKHSFYLPFRKPSLESNKGIWGCNWGINLRFLEKVNGFDMDYELAGVGEDVDIEWRLRQENVSIFYVKHRPIVYHLNHKVHYNNSVVDKGMKRLALKKEKKISFCKNGLDQL